MKITKVEESVYRGPQPITDDDWQQIVDLKICNVIDLETYVEEPEAFKHRTGLAITRRPLSFLVAPSVCDLVSLANLIKTFRSNGGVYVHCRQGVDRTGMVIAAYRILCDGWSRKDAIKEMWREGFHFWYFFWIFKLFKIGGQDVN
jgi:tyrosine-protein phosphatase SIW14